MDGLFLTKLSAFNKLLKKDLSKKKITLLLVLLAIIFFVLFGITTDKTLINQTTDENTSESQQVAGSQEVKGESSTQEDAAIQEEESKLQTDVETEGVKVTKVIDGDTIEIEGGARVRYIGIDTPETVHPSGIVECYGRQASSKNRELVEGKTVKLEKDVSELDKYGRLLRYVYVDDIFVNDYLVRLGYASASSYPPDIKYQNQFAEAQREARENNRGLWEACKGNNQLEQSPTTTQPPASTGDNCDSSYPTVCIVPPPPDLDCADIVYRRFKVVPPDSHNFDGNHDGVGCESL